MEHGEQTSCGQETPVNGKHYEWQLSDGQQWLPIDHDHVIESHYCQPGAKGITLNFSHMQVFVDFDSLRTQTAGLSVRRLSLLPRGHAQEDVGWYFRDDQLWREYGSLQTSGTPSSISSGEVERRFALNPQGTFSFTVGSVGYTLDFSAMAQTNCITGLRRNVRRRPKFTSNAGSFSSTSASSDGGYTWEFMDDEGKWTKYEANKCTLDSAAIERQYQLNPQGRLHFSTERHSYTLDFAGMRQVNDTFGTARAARRRRPQSGSSSTAPRWQFQDVGGIWRDYCEGSSISSQDLELRYQQNPSGSVSFTTGSFLYELSFSAMSQKNLSTSTTRSVRRLTQ